MTDFDRIMLGLISPDELTADQAAGVLEEAYSRHSAELVLDLVQASLVMLCVYEQDADLQRRCPPRDADRDLVA